MHAPRLNARTRYRGRWLFWCLMGALGVALAWLLLRPRPVWVEVAVVAQGPLQVRLSEEGKTRVRDRYVLSAPVSGYLQRIVHKVGDAVAPGDELTRLTPAQPQVLDARSRATAQARVAAAEAQVQVSLQNVNAAEAQAQLAQSHHQRLVRLGRTDFVAIEALQAAEMDMRRSAASLRSARFAADVARHELAAARTQLEVTGATPPSGNAEQVPVRAPVAGMVLGVRRESEGVIGAGEPLLELGDPAALEVVVELLSRDAAAIRSGLTVQLDGWGGTPLAGQVRLIEPVGFTKVSALGVEEQRVRVLVDITSPREQWPSLGDGYRVDAHILLWQAEDVVQIPRAALYHTADGPAVYRISGDLAQAQPVRIGQDDGFNVQILEGLSVDQRVILHPDARITDGTPVLY